MVTDGDAARFSYVCGAALTRGPLDSRATRENDKERAQGLTAKLVREAGAKRRKRECRRVSSVAGLEFEGECLGELVGAGR